MKIGIVGLGLIGGSIAKSIKAKTSHTVYGADISEETMLLARMLGSYDAPLTDENIGDCDIVILALCPETAVDWAEKNAHKIAKEATLADICGVKRAVFDNQSRRKHTAWKSRSLLSTLPRYRICAKRFFRL